CQDNGCSICGVSACHNYSTKSAGSNKCTDGHNTNANNKCCPQASHDHTNSKRQLNHPQYLKSGHARGVRRFNHRFINILHPNIRILSDRQNGIKDQCHNSCVCDKSHNNHNDCHSAANLHGLTNTPCCEYPSAQFTVLCN